MLCTATLYICTECVKEMKGKERNELEVYERLHELTSTMRDISINLEIIYIEL